MNGNVNQEALAAVDALLTAAAPYQPPAAAVLAARRAIAAEIRQADLAEVMTLEEVAAFLRIDPDDLGEILAELPAFELAGRVRVRRERLIEWIRRRERDYARKAAASWAANAIRGGAGKGVA